jgi:hypothetical protein
MSNLPEPRFLEMEIEELEAKAARELIQSPALFALLYLRLEETTEEYDVATAMEEVKFVRGKRKVFSMLLDLPETVNDRKQASMQTEADLITLDRQ